MRRSRTCKRRVERNGSSFSRRQKSGLLLQRLNHVAGVVAYSSMQLLLQLRTSSIYSRTKFPLCVLCSCVHGVHLQLRHGVNTFTRVAKGGATGAATHLIVVRQTVQHVLPLRMLRLKLRYDAGN